MAKLTRSTTDKKLFGVCGGLAEYFGWDSTIIRLLFVVAGVFTLGTTILVYLVMALVMPEY